MLLVVDVGNTNTVLGLFEGDRLSDHWRVATDRNRTSDEYAVMLRQLFEMTGQTVGSITGCIISCVVPPMQPVMMAMVERYFSVKPLVVGPGIKTGMPILYENPREVGADRIVNAVAAFEQTRSATIVVDFGTATTFDAVSSAGEYLGGAICPGVVISAEALFQRASKLPRVEITSPGRVIARNTIASMQAGIVYGYVGLVDGMAERMKAEYGAPMKVLATGGLCDLFAEHSRQIETFDRDLTLRGLQILYDRNVRG
jgi:type III pantothenate kinase